MGMWDKFVLPTIGNTIGDIVGPLTNSSKPMLERGLRSAAGLASLFAGPAKQALMYSPESEAALFPAKMLRSNHAQRLLEGGMSPEDIARKHQLVHDGRAWNEFERDVINPEALNKVNYSSGFPNSESLSSVMSLGNVNKHISPNDRAKYNQTLRETGISTRNMDPTLMGSYYPELQEIFLNKKLTPMEMTDTTRHESQHALDRALGRSYGTNVKAMSTSENPHLGKSNNPFSDYAHNVGEVRARLNERLNNSFDMGIDEPIGLSELFTRNSPYESGKIWGE